MRRCSSNLGTWELSQHSLIDTGKANVEQFRGRKSVKFEIKLNQYENAIKESRESNSNQICLIINRVNNYFNKNINAIRHADFFIPFTRIESQDKSVEKR